MMVLVMVGLCIAGILLLVLIVVAARKPKQVNVFVAMDKYRSSMARPSKTDPMAHVLVSPASQAAQNMPKEKEAITAKSTV